MGTTMLVAVEAGTLSSGVTSVMSVVSTVMTTITNDPILIAFSLLRLLVLLSVLFVSSVQNKLPEENNVGHMLHVVF